METEEKKVRDFINLIVDIVYGISPQTDKELSLAPILSFEALFEDRVKESLMIVNKRLMNYDYPFSDYIEDSIRVYKNYYQIIVRERHKEGLLYKMYKDYPKDWAQAIVGNFIDGLELENDVLKLELSEELKEELQNLNKDEIAELKEVINVPYIEVLVGCLYDISCYHYYYELLYSEQGTSPREHRTRKAEGHTYNATDIDFAKMLYKRLKASGFILDSTSQEQFEALFLNNKTTNITPVVWEGRDKELIYLVYSIQQLGLVTSVNRSGFNWERFTSCFKKKEGSWNASSLKSQLSLIKSDFDLRDVDSKFPEIDRILNQINSRI